MYLHSIIYLKCQLQDSLKNIFGVFYPSIGDGSISAGIMLTLAQNLLKGFKGLGPDFLVISALSIMKKKPVSALSENEIPTSH
jgi:hypothetical protein